MTAPRALRALFLAGLAWAAAATLRGVDGGGTLAVAEGDPDALAPALVSDRPPGRILWTGAQGPGGRASWLLSPGPAVPPLVLQVGTSRRLRVSPPVRPTAGRAAALDVTLDTPSSTDTVVIAWRDALGEGDSVSVVPEPPGRVRAGLQVRPGRAGWHRWTVRAGADSVEVGAWVLPERPVRVLALAGPPDWETRFALRALDEAGVQVDVRFDVGRVDIGEAAWAPDEYDVVLLLGDAAAGLEPETGAALEDLVAFVRAGGGLLVAPGRASVQPAPMGALLRALGLGEGVTGGPVLEPGHPVAWALPAELAPLPAPTSRAATLSPVGAVPSIVAARAPDGTPLVAARAVGRGRAAVLGLSESWRWRMEGGLVEAHRSWWRAWAEWAASGLRRSVAATLPTEPVPVGSVVPVVLEALDPGAALPERIRLERPDGSVEELPTREVDVERREARFLARAAGSHRLAWPEGEAGVVATDDPPDPDPSQRALLAMASGRPGARGTPVPPGETAASALDGDEGRPWRGGDRGGAHPLLGILLAVAVLAEWSVRRLRGGP